MRLVRVPHVPRGLGLRAASALAGIILLTPGAAAAPVEPFVRSGAVMAVTSGDACLDAEEISFLALINDHRSLSGLAPLSVSSSLSSAAAYHSIDMAAKGYLDHTLIDGTTVQQNMANFGYQGGASGENIAAGTDTAVEAMQTWQNSADHNANMLSSQFGAIGIGRAYDESSQYGWYWTTIFGDVSDGPGWQCGQSPPPGKGLSLFQSVDGATTLSDVNLRSGPGDSYDLVATLPPDSAMTVTGGEVESYVPVNVDGQFGWVGAEWIQRGAVSLEQTAAPSEAGTATTIGAVEMLSSPGSAGAVMASIPSVSVVTLTGEAQDGFLGVMHDGQEGWADAAYLEVADIAAGTTLLQPVETSAPVEAAANAPAPPMAASPGTQALTTTNVNLRSQPNATSVVLSVLPAGSPVSLTGSQANGYVNVRVEGQAGWIDSAYLQ